MAEEESIAEWRKSKDSLFLQDRDSPLPDSEKPGFKGLKYFEPDKRYVVRARLARYGKPEAVELTTSKGTRQKYLRVGFFEFKLNGEEVRLNAYVSAEREDKELFVPFRDGTSGKESYGSARYLDLPASPDDVYVIDFNYAYNPYCAYSDDYVCPFPPRENWLTVEIRAGEKKYHD